MSEAAKPRILYLCTGNTCRSQMAEAFTNSLRDDDFAAVSAGVAPGRVDPRAIKAMAEAGLDIGDAVSKDVSQFLGQEFAYIVTLCSNARETCPFFPGRAKRAHRGFDDPPLLAAGAADEEEAMAPYRRVRDQIRAMVEGLPASLEGEED